MNKKTESEITKLENSIKCNDCIIENHPELKEGLDRKSDVMRKQIEELRSPPVAIKKDGEFEAGKDLGWNCLAVQKDGQPCKSHRRHGNYCGRHLIHYVKELEEKSDDRA